MADAIEFDYKIDWSVGEVNSRSTRQFSPAIDCPTILLASKLQPPIDPTDEG